MKTKDYQHLINKYRTHALTSVYNDGLRDMAQQVISTLATWSAQAEGQEIEMYSKVQGMLYIYFTKVLQEVESAR